MKWWPDESMKWEGERRRLNNIKKIDALFAIIAIPLLMDWWNLFYIVKLKDVVVITFDSYILYIVIFTCVFVCLMKQNKSLSPDPIFDDDDDEMMIKLFIELIGYFKQTNKKSNMLGQLN